MKPWRANPNGKKSGFGKTNKQSRRSHDHSRPCRLRYNSNRKDLDNAKRKLRRHLDNYPKDLCARAAWDRQGFK
jgi:hypothetical protein